MSTISHGLLGPLLHTPKRPAILLISEHQQPSREKQLASKLPTNLPKKPLQTNLVLVNICARTDGSTEQINQVCYLTFYYFYTWINLPSFIGTDGSTAKLIKCAIFSYKSVPALYYFDKGK